MSIELIGNKDTASDLRFCCKMYVDNDLYVGVVTSKYYEYDSRYDDRIVYSAQFKDISKLNIFLNRLTLSFSDSNNDLFTIYSSKLIGIFGFGRKLQIKNHTLKIPRTFSFSLPEIGFEIKMERTKFQSKIRNEKDIGIGIGLSYFIWLQHQRWINMD